MRTLALVFALCVAGCQFAVEGLGGDVSSGGQQQGPAVDLAPAPAVDAGADLAPAPDLASGNLPQPPPPPPPGPTGPMDCRITGCPMNEQCMRHGNMYECSKGD